MREMPDVRKHCRQIGTADTEPCCERCGEFIDRSRRNPAASSGVVGAVDGQRGECAEKSAPVHGAAHNELMAAPAVIGTGPIRWERAAEIGCGESRDGIGDAQFRCGGIKCVQCLAQLR